MACYGFPRLARQFPAFSEFGALALSGIVVLKIGFSLRYPVALTAALYATLAYGYLLQPTESAEKQDFKAVAQSLSGTNHSSSVTLATLVGLAIALLFPILPYRQPFLDLLIACTKVSWITAWELVGIVFKIATVFAVFFIVIEQEGRSLESIGWRTPRLKDLVFGVAAFLAVQELTLVTWPLAGKAMPSSAAEIQTGFALYRSLPLSVNLIGAICNAVAEEVGFRGYALERLSEITGSLWLGAGIPYVVEVLCHAPIWGFQGMLLQAPRLLVFVLLYLWQRSLPACIFGHLLSDVIPIFW